MTRQLQLTGGFVALVDDEDYARVAPYKWNYYRSRNTYYAISRLGRRGTARRSADFISLHRFLLNLPTFRPGDLQVDHINGDGLDCRRSNLRLARHGQNRANAIKTRPSAGATSGFKGVFRHLPGIWRVKCAGRHVGLFTDERAAALAYNQAAALQFGEFARFNELTPLESTSCDH